VKTENRIGRACKARHTEREAAAMKEKSAEKKKHLIPADEGKTGGNARHSAGSSR